MNPLLEALEADEQLARTLAPIEGELRTGRKLQAAKAAADMRRVAEAEARQRRRHIDGLGALQMRIPVDKYFEMERLYGKGCWNDEDFVRHCQKHTPGLLLRSEGGRMIFNGAGQPVKEIQPNG